MPDAGDPLGGDRGFHAFRDREGPLVGRGGFQFAVHGGQAVAEGHLGLQGVRGDGEGSLSVALHLVDAALPVSWRG